MRIKMRKVVPWTAAFAGVFILLVGMGFFYQVNMSPNKGYYRTQYGLMPGAILTLHGEVVDQYGQPVAAFPLEVVPGFEGDMTSFLHSPVKRYRFETDSQGRIAFSSSPVKLRMVFIESTGEWGPSVVNGEAFMAGYGIRDSEYILFYDGKQWMNDARSYSTSPLPFDTNNVVFRVGRSGLPVRLLEYELRLAIPEKPYYKGEESWFSLNLLEGKIYSGRQAGCEIIGHATNVDAYTTNAEWRSYKVEFVAAAGTLIQFGSDPFHCEAPKSGYESRLEYGLVKEGRKWIPLDANVGLPPWHIYFVSHDQQVYGSLQVDLGLIYNQIEWLVHCKANPRGDRNLNNQKVAKIASQGGFTKPIKPPISLPFVEPLE